MPCRRLSCFILFAVCCSGASAETIAVIGTGNVAAALGPEFAQQGHTIVYGSRSPDASAPQKLVEETAGSATVTLPADAVLDADVVVLAVPGMLAADIVEGLGDLSGKIIIDPTNPMQVEQMTFRHAVATSNTQIIQELAPKAHVVKAFNTLGWKQMIYPETAGGPVSIPLAGESDKAKKFVAELATGMGLEPVDVGGVENAHWLEGMAILLLNNRYGSRESFDYYLRKVE
ncbi:MAG: NADPH-dependent F420 reductase [Woeseiaceae bacterium]